MQKLCMMFAVLSAVFLAGCGEGLYVDRAFVGTWYWIDNVQYTYVFESDGTGRWWDLSVEDFTWGTRDGKLVLDFGPAFRNIELTYIFDGNMLNLTDERSNFYYFRFVPDQNLIGNWVILGDYMVGKTMNPDGTGYSSHFLSEPGEEISFNWFTANDLLIIHLGPLLQDMWTYTISGDVLNLVSRQVTGLTQEFRRGAFTQNPALIGLWAWIDDEEWLFYFGANSMGEFGWTYEESPMFWTSFGDMLILLVDGFYEEWTFTISGDILHLVNINDPEEQYSYIRVR